MIKLENGNTIETIDTKERKYKMFEEYKTISIKLEKFNDIKEGDIIEAYTMEAIKRKEL